MAIPILALIGKFETLHSLAGAFSASSFVVLLQQKCPLTIRVDLALQIIDRDGVELGCSHPWLAWDQTGDSQVVAEAYQAGARAVFPKETPINIIVETVHRAIAELLQSNQAVKQPKQRTYRRGELILLEADAVLHVEQGVLATTMIHQDGAEVLLGLSGKGQIVVAHPDDNCHIQIVAHTEASVHIESWGSAVQHPDFTAKLRARLQQMEGWAAMQARPSLQQRILGLLGLLAEQFGKPCETGIVIEVRITHNQLAAAVGATRTSITRVLSELRAQGRISTVTRDGDDLLCLTEISDRHYHY
jgi:CRP-like cAMP-binding protein